MLKKLSIYQIALAGTSLILIIIAHILEGSSMMSFSRGMYNFAADTSWGIVRLIRNGVFVAIFVIGIVQIVQVAKKSNGLVLSAGILGVLSFIPFVVVAVLVVNAIVLSKK